MTLVWDLPEPPRPQLNRDAIVAAATAIADSDGVQAVTMRRVAGEVGSSTPMSLYRYVGGKDGITDLMLDQVFREIDLPDQPPTDWREAMRLLASHTRIAVRRHPWFGALAHHRPLFGPFALRHNEWSLTALDGLKRPLNDAMSVAAMVFGYAVSYAQNEAEEYRMRSRTGLHTDADLRAAAGPYVERITTDGRYPRLSQWLAEGADSDPDAQFTLGLECLLDGIGLRMT